MRSACSHNVHMPRTIRIINVPEDIHGKLKAQAAMAGMNLSEFLRDEIVLVANRPTLDELEARIRPRKRAMMSVDSAAMVRAEREARG